MDALIGVHHWKGGRLERVDRARHQFDTLRNIPLITVCRNCLSFPLPPGKNRILAIPAVKIGKLKIVCSMCLQISVWISRFTIRTVIVPGIAWRWAMAIPFSVEAIRLNVASSCDLRIRLSSTSYTGCFYSEKQKRKAIHLIRPIKSSCLMFDFIKNLPAIKNRAALLPANESFLLKVEPLPLT